MKLLTQSAGFVVFALILQALWMLLRVDVLEDLNLFAGARYWPWFAGAVLLHALLAAVGARIRRPAAGHGVVFGLLAILLVIGLLAPPLTGGDGIAVGMLQFLNGYWILSVWVFCLLSSGLAMGIIGHT